MSLPAYFQNSIIEMTERLEQAYIANKIEKVSTLNMNQIIPWFLAQRKQYPQSDAGILMRYSAVQEKKHGSIRKWLFRGMQKGYVQFLLDEEDREVREIDQLVMRYFEADAEDDEIKKQFGNSNIIRFE